MLARGAVHNPEIFELIKNQINKNTSLENELKEMEALDGQVKIWQDELKDIDSWFVQIKAKYQNLKIK